MPFDDQNEWKPNPKQAEFLRIPLTVKEGFFGGGAGSGKSELLFMFSLVHGWHHQEGFKQLFLRRTHPEIKNEIWPRAKRAFHRVGGKPNESDLTWTFPREDQYGSGYSPDGGIIKFGHCQNEDDVHIYDGMEINLFTPDELTSFTEYIYTYIGFTRVRTSNPKLPAIIRASGMPGDIGHAFVKKRFVDPFPSGGVLVSGRAGIKRIYIHSTYKDNPKGDPNYGQSLEALPNEAERRAKKYGDWSTYEGQVFDELREKHYPGEPDNALHVIEPLHEIPKHWPRIMAIDWGFNAMCSIGFAAISPEPRVYVYRHLSFVREKIEEWAPKVKPYVETDMPNDVIICHSANQHRGDPHSILEQVTEALGIPIRLGERDRVAGKNLIHEYLRWRSFLPESQIGQYSDVTAQWILRNKSFRDYQAYLSSFTTHENEVLPKLRFFNTEDVRLVWETLKFCNYEKNSKDGKKKEDIAEFDGDDPYDMLRMLLHAADQFFATAQDAQVKLERTERVIKQFETSNDMTGYYRNMRVLDKENTDSVKPITRFHKGRRR